ncbi:MAG TPA: hypothetical protein VM802_23635 [Chitinophaga sp.]|uniref:hypothetical protein n=1 Tax=Chitinophaga sp. TaxID=1869181 RepID=UPI002CD8F400|nr:hypothetical protein [Chitinophaga sp.]HVI47881.1 hypothetical protein [Chitinophaga sp.]
MRSIEITAPVRRLPVVVKGCPHCQATNGTLYIDHVISATGILGLEILKTHSTRALVYCDSCHKYVKKKYWPTALLTQARAEQATVGLTFIQRYGAWLLIIAVIAGLAVYFKLK